MNQEPENDNHFTSGESSRAYPVKPEVATKKENALRRSLISLLIYAVLFYFLFDRNVVYIAAVLLVLIIHEAGHFAMMKLFGYSNLKIFIVPLLGAFTSGKKQQVSQWQLTLIILGGPIPGIIIGSLLYWQNKQDPSENVGILANSFLIINLLNCLPFYPLDGGRLLETLFFRENHLIRLVFGIISIIGLALFFIYLQSIILLIIPALIVLELRNEIKYEKIREYLRQEKINYHVEYNQLPDKDYWLIRDCLILSYPKKYAGLAPGQYEYSIFEGIMVQQVQAILKVNLKADLRIFQKLLILFVFAMIVTAPLAMYLYFKMGTS